ncbi:MAG: ATP synthase F1 subunit gamma [Candidatus Dojkabacteria bacterium]|nr:ATP synthase F1 subunit gamma [Candidatus Dojkabacteria bacterium]
MSTLLNIQNKIRATKNTGQLTKALEMISVTKQKKAREYLIFNSAIRDGIRKIINQLYFQEKLNNLDNEILPKYFRKNTESSKKHLILLIMSQRGLCGSINTLLIQKLINYKENILSKNKNIKFDIIKVNKYAQKISRSLNYNIVAYFDNINDLPSIEDTLPISDLVKKLYDEYETIHIAYTQFVKPGQTTPVVRPILPINVSTGWEENYLSSTPYIIEPNPITVLEEIARLYIDLEIYYAILTSQASEHTSRMIAMKKASDNAKNLVKTLTLLYNKERQAKITKQTIEITSSI